MARYTNTITAAVAFTLAGAVSAPAHAYIDPGTGGFLVQMLLGGVAGVLVVGKLYWQRVRAFFGVKPADETERD